MSWRTVIISHRAKLDYKMGYMVVRGEETKRVFLDDGICIAEKMLNYMELVREFDRDRLFIIVNMRSYIDEASVKSFMDTLISHKYHCIMFESTSYSRLDNEKRYTVDEDLCEL